MRRFSVFAALVAGLLLVFLPSATAGNGPKSGDTHVQLLAFNDFHGNLAPPGGSSGRIQVGIDANGKAVNVDAGGMEYLATRIENLRAADPDTLVVSAGDNIGASPLLSGLFHDEPTIEALNLIGLDLSAVGNHEFDEGVAELERMQDGGCHPADGCQDGTPFDGAAFQYLASNVIRDSNGHTLFPAYKVRTVHGTRVAFIAATLAGAPLIVTPAGVAGVHFTPEAAAINAVVEQLQESKGIHAFVVLLHQGGAQSPPSGSFADVNGCAGFTGEILPVLSGLDSDVDVVVSGHSHNAYVCNVGGKLVTAASSFGRVLTDIDLTIDPTTDQVVAKSAQNIINTRTDVAKDPAITALMNSYMPFYAPIANRVVGSITADITRAQNAAGETALGDVIADGQLEATAPASLGGAVIAFTNIGGVRADLTKDQISGGEQPGEVTYAEAFNVQPFANTMVVKTFTGDQIRLLLEQQFGATADTSKTLQVSDGFSYSWNSAAPVGSRVDPSSMMLDGLPIDPAATYRVAMNNFLADGGDGFSVFKLGTEQVGGAVDIDAFAAYLTAHSPVPPGPMNRITKTG